MLCLTPIRSARRARRQAGIRLARRRLSPVDRVPQCVVDDAKVGSVDGHRLISDGLRPGAAAKDVPVYAIRDLTAIQFPS
jgi:hypothetical protein